VLVNVGRAVATAATVDDALVAAAVAVDFAWEAEAVDTERVDPIAPAVPLPALVDELEAATIARDVDVVPPAVEARGDAATGEATEDAAIGVGEATTEAWATGVPEGMGVILTCPQVPAPTVTWLVSETPLTAGLVLEHDDWKTARWATLVCDATLPGTRTGGTYAAQRSEVRFAG
jgi:hypothetical protein